MLLDRHRAKIVTTEALGSVVGPLRIGGRTVVLCCGVFDIIHPGHLRHLLYAKSKADLLVAGLVADRYVTKGPYRPHVPQDIRAMNLAVLDVVDFVVIYDEEQPLGLIRSLHPDFYAKGFEYSETARPGETLSETSVVGEYGGQMLFTPGDIVYSSSELIEKAPPLLRYEKLHLVMDRYGLEFDDLRRTLDRIPGQQVHVVGDTIVDRYTHCSMTGGQAKTPTLSVLRERQEDFVGGAGVVAKHLAAAGANVRFSTVLGDDRLRFFVQDDLQEAGIETDVLVDESRPTTCKEAIVVGDYRLLKIDVVDNRSISDATLGELVEVVRLTPRESAVVYSDFRHGVFNSRTTPALVSASEGFFRAADSQVASRWGNILDFPGFDLVTPNEREARFSLADQDSGVRPLATRLFDRAGCSLLILKLGERGVLTCMSGDHDSPDSFFFLDSFANRATDPVGAGDALLAYAVLAMQASDRSPVQASILGAIAAGAECERDGNCPINLEYVRVAVDRLEEEI